MPERIRPPDDPRGARAPTARAAGRYRIRTGDGGSTEQLVEAGRYGYAHSCVISENFPVLSGRDGCRVRDLQLLQFDRVVTADEVLAAALSRGLERPSYEDALRFGIEHPMAQGARPVVFLHEPWLGYFGRRDVMCLWSNAGRRELGLDDFDGTWSPEHRFAFVMPAGPSRGSQPGSTPRGASKAGDVSAPVPDPPEAGSDGMDPVPEGSWRSGRTA